MKEVYSWLCLLNYGLYFLNFIYLLYKRVFCGDGENMVSKFLFLLLLSKLLEDVVFLYF